MASVSDENVQVTEASQNVGERLRLAREAKQFSIAEVAAQLRFTKNTIFHLETKQWDKLHGRAYARGYFANYVKFLGMPQDELLSAFNLEYKSTPSDLMQPQFNLAKKKSFPWMPVLFIFIAIVITGFAYLQWQQSQKLDQDTSTQGSAWQQSQESEPRFNAFDASVVEPMLADEPSSQEPVKYFTDELDAVEPELESNETELELNTPINTNGEFEIQPNIDELSENLLISESLLELSSLQDCWVEVRDAELNVLVFQTIKANEKISLTGNAPFNIVLGSASHVTVIFNDSLFDTTPYTSAGVARFTLRVMS